MKKSFYTTLLLVVSFVSFPLLSGQQNTIVTIPKITTKDAVFKITALADKLQYPWVMAFLPEGGILITERGGKIVQITSEGRKIYHTPPLPVTAQGQGGLLDIALHPHFVQNRYVYVTFVVSEEGGLRTALARLRFINGKFDAPERLWTMKSKSTTAIHFGSRIAFAPDGILYLSTGDRNMREFARMPGEDAGKLLRLTDTGKPAPGNPFLQHKAYLPEIYSLGHRNIQGLAINSKTGEVWLTEHGPKGGDELNLIMAGADYGWPLVSFGVEYSGAIISQTPYAPGVTPPVLHWTPSIAPSGLAFYYGDAFPAWKGNLLTGSLAGQKLVRIILEDNREKGQEILIDGQLGRIRDVRVGPDGLVYIITDAVDGKLFRLEPIQ